MLWQALLTLAVPALGAVVHESIAAVPDGWTQLSVSDESEIYLQVAVQLRNLDQLESKLLSVSDPASSAYGKYLEKEDVDALFAPSTEDVEKVKSWIATADAKNVEYLSGVVSFSTSISKANELLGTKFGLYTNGKTSKVRTLSYSIPEDLVDSIDLVTPTTMFGETTAHAAIPNAMPAAEPEPELVPEASSAMTLRERQLKTACEKQVVFDNITFPLIGPQCLMELYSTTGYTPDAKSGSSIAFGSFLNQSAVIKDAKKFLKIWGLPVRTFDILGLIQGGVNDQNATVANQGEANLDSQNILGLVGDLPVGEYITGGSPPFIPDLLQPNASENQNEPYLPYYQYLLSQNNSDLPYVFSNSYGDIENTVPIKYAKRVCNLIGMMGMRGRSIMESSGDLGVGAVCLTDQGPREPQFDAVFPATCPYLTSVGGLQFYNPENAWNASSGGFSMYFSQPSYQTSSINTYLTKYISAATKAYYSDNNFTNFAGRGFPDVSAHSLYPYYLTVISETAYPNGGTSAASPVFASVIALVNDALLRAGKPALGFLNPWLYSKAAPGGGLNDITLGGSKGCHERDLQSGEIIKGAGVIKYASWNATVGWDPVTGLGSPNFTGLKKVALSS